LKENRQALSVTDEDEIMMFTLKGQAVRSANALNQRPLRKEQPFFGIIPQQDITINLTGSQLLD